MPSRRFLTVMTAPLLAALLTLGAAATAAAAQVPGVNGEAATTLPIAHAQLGIH